MSFISNKPKETPSYQNSSNNQEQKNDNNKAFVYKKPSSFHNIKISSSSGNNNNNSDNSQKGISLKLIDLKNKILKFLIQIIIIIQILTIKELVT